MYKYYLYVILTLLLCTPISAYSFDLPEISYPVNSQTISELNPVFKWEPSTYKDAKYDLVLFKPGSLELPNKPIFYKKNISKTEFQIPIRLERKTRYIWFVRVRENNKVTPWQAQQHTMPYVTTSPALMMVAAFWNQTNGHSFITE